MNEERWHNFAKEKPSEDMEGRNFIVSNGHYEKIATWCGYWENEPFMGDRLCDEVVRWKFYFTPEEEKANEATHTELKPMKCDKLQRYEVRADYDAGTIDVPCDNEKYGNYMLAEDVIAAIAELKARIQLDDDEMAGFLQLEEECGGGDLRNYIAELKDKIQMHDFFWEGCGFEKRGFKNAIAVAQYVEDLEAKLRATRRALWLARAERAKEKQQLFHFSLAYNKLCIDGFYNPYSGRRELSPKQWIKVFNKAENKCRAKAELYK